MNKFGSVYTLTKSIPPSIKPKLFVGETIASAAGASMKISPEEICKARKKYVVETSPKFYHFTF